MKIENYAFLSLLDTPLQQDGILNLDMLIEDALKVCLIYNPYCYIIDGHVIDNKAFRQRCLHTTAPFRKFLAEEFGGSPPLKVGLRKGSRSLLDTLDDMLAIDKKGEEPVYFSSLTPEQNKKIMELHKQKQLTRDKFFEIARWNNAIILTELQEIDNFLTDNKLYSETPQTPSAYKDRVICTCEILRQSEHKDAFGKALKTIASDFYNKGKDTIFQEERFKRSYGYRTLDEVATGVAPNFKGVFKRIVLDYTYNANIAKNSLLNLQLHGTTFSDSIGFFLEHNIKLKEGYDFTIERLETKGFAAQIDDLSYKDIKVIRTKLWDKLTSLQEKKTDEKYLLHYTNEVLDIMRKKGILRDFSIERTVKWLKITDMLERLKWVELGGGAAVELGQLAQNYYVPNNFFGFGFYAGIALMGLSVAPMVVNRFLASSPQGKEFEINFKESYKPVK